MTWAKLDDRFHSHPKIVAAGLTATGLYALSLSYAACHETDGQIPEAWVKQQRSPRAVARLAELGLWEPTEEGYVIPDFLDYNPSRAEVAERRKANTARVQKHRKKRSVTPSVTHYPGSGRDGSGNTAIKGEAKGEAAA